MSSYSLQLYIVGGSGFLNTSPSAAPAGQSFTFYLLNLPEPQPRLGIVLIGQGFGVARGPGVLFEMLAMERTSGSKYWVMQQKNANPRAPICSWKFN